jgi:hypothetical protein
MMSLPLRSLTFGYCFFIFDRHIAGAPSTERSKQEPATDSPDGVSS